MIADESIEVLIADDQPLIRAALMLSLGRLPGLEVVGEAADGADAVRQTLTLAPHVVLMDVNMPVMDGIEATRLIKQRMSSVKVLIVSGHEQQSVVAAAMAAGADGHFVKSTSVALLEQAIRSVAAGAVWFDPLIGKHAAQGMAGTEVQEHEKSAAISLVEAPRVPFRKR